MPQSPLSGSHLAPRRFPALYFLSFSNKKKYFYKFKYVPEYMRKIVDLCFYFLLIKKLGKSTLFFGSG